VAKYKFFIAGTDTDVGKTLVAQGLLEAAKQRGLSCYGLKPIAAGCESTERGLENQDALRLMHASSVKLSYQQVNPIALKAAIAPHVAAAMENRKLEGHRVVGFCRGAMMTRADLVLVEGAGGWRVPLNSRETLAMLPKDLNLPVILVVGIKLGCINHALLTVEAIIRDGIELAGWVANKIDPDMSQCTDTIDYLRAAIKAPLIGVIPYIKEVVPELLGKHLQIDRIL